MEDKQQTPKSQRKEM